MNRQEIHKAAGDYVRRVLEDGVDHFIRNWVSTGSVSIQCSVYFII